MRGAAWARLESIRVVTSAERRIPERVVDRLVGVVGGAVILGGGVGVGM